MLSGLILSAETDRGANFGIKKNELFNLAFLLKGVIITSNMQEETINTFVHLFLNTSPKSASWIFFSDLNSILIFYNIPRPKKIEIT